MKKPNVYYNINEEGCHILRFTSLFDIFYYDDEIINPNGLGKESYSSSTLENYKKELLTITPIKQALIDKVQKELLNDSDFQKLLYKEKSYKRKLVKNKHGGNLSMTRYSRDEEKIFDIGKIGSKKPSLSIAIQIGVFADMGYKKAFVDILKLILSIKALNVPCTLDFFDSDTAAIADRKSIVLVNVFNTQEKFDLRKILVAYHRQFFDYTLFNAYSASENQNRIGTFLADSTIVRNLKPYYNIIGGNAVDDNYQSMMNKITKIIHT